MTSRSGGAGRIFEPWQRLFNSRRRFGSVGLAARVGHLVGSYKRNGVGVEPERSRSHCRCCPDGTGSATIRPGLHTLGEFMTSTSWQKLLGLSATVALVAAACTVSSGDDDDGS